jgi:hypothetical protein
MKCLLKNLLLFLSLSIPFNWSQAESVPMLEFDPLFIELINYHLKFGEISEIQPVYFLQSEEEVKSTQKYLTFENKGSDESLNSDIALVVSLNPDDQKVRELPLKFCLMVDEVCEDVLVWDSLTQTYNDVLMIQELPERIDTAVALEFLFPPSLTQTLKTKELKEPQPFELKARVDTADPMNPLQLRKAVSLCEIKIVDLSEQLKSNRPLRVGRTEQKEETQKWIKRFDKNFGGDEVSVRPSAEGSFRYIGGEAGFAAGINTKTKLTLEVFGEGFNLVDSTVDIALLPANQSEPNIDEVWGPLGYFKDGQKVDPGPWVSKFVDLYNEKVDAAANTREEHLEKYQMVLSASVPEMDTMADGLRDATKKYGNDQGWEVKQDSNRDGKFDGNDIKVDLTKTAAEEREEHRKRYSDLFAGMADKIMNFDYDSSDDSDRIEAKASIKSLGLNLWSPPKFRYDLRFTLNKSYRKEKKKAKTFIVVFVPVKIEAGVSGEIGIENSVSAWKGFLGVTTELKPYMNFGMYVNASTTMAVAEVGVKGTLDIVDVSSTLKTNMYFKDFTHFRKYPVSKLIRGDYLHTLKNGNTVKIKGILGSGNAGIYHTLVGPTGDIGPYVKYPSIVVEWRRKCVRWIGCASYPWISLVTKEKYWPLASFNTFEYTYETPIR